MRLLKLQLERYGCFTDRTLTFREDACLHIVYGSNEAGKSTALAAVTDLFFGFGTRTTYDFQHPANKLSIAAELRGKDKDIFTFRRRKGTKNTLLRLDGAVLPDDSLRPFIGSMDRKVFSHAFGLSQTTLRAGADEMLATGGEAGSSLLAAASGLSNLSKLSNKLENEASALFMPTRAASRAFYQALTRFEEASQLVRSLELKAPDARKKREELDSALAALKTVREQRRDAGIRREQVKRQRELVPLLRLIEADDSALATWTSFQELSASQVLDLRRTFDAVQQSTVELRRRERLVEEAKALLESYEIDDALLTHASQIDALQERVGGVEARKSDLPRVHAEANSFQDQLTEARVRLGLQANLDFASLQPSDQLIIKTQDLIGRGLDLQVRIKGNAGALVTERNLLADITRQLNDSLSTKDPAPSRRAFTQLTPALVRLPDVKRLDRSCKAEAQSIAEKGRQLSPPIANLDTFAQLSAPSTATVTASENTRSLLEKSANNAEARLIDKRVELAKAQQTLSERSTTSGTVTLDGIRQVREDRQSKWGPIRSIIVGASPLPAPSEGVLQAGAFEASISSADELADRALVDAERVTQYTEAQKRVRDLSDEVQKQEDAVTGAKRKVEDNEREWNQLWITCKISPQSPQAMLLWLSDVATLLERRAKVQKDTTERDQLRESVIQVQPKLAAMVLSLDLYSASDLPLELTAKAIEDEIANREKTWQSTSILLTRQAESKNRLAALELSATTLSTENDAWATEWKDLTPQIHLSVSATLPEVTAALDIWKGVPAVEREFKNRSRRVTRMREETDDFAKDMHALLKSLKRTDAGVSPETDAQLLAKALQEARSTQSQAGLAKTQLDEANRKAASAKTDDAERQAELEALAKVLPGVGTVPEELLAVEAREVILARLRDRRQTLLPLSRGETEKALRTTLVAFDEDAASVEVESLVQSEMQLNSKENELFAEVTAKQTELDTLQGGLGAEIALQKRKNAEAELVSIGEKWAVKYLGVLLLKQAMEQHRKQQEHPLMKRAGELFATLSNQSFNSIEQEVDDHDEIRLVGRRDAERTVCVPAMSEGTRDQLYLALRLAYLEQYGDLSGPLPFIGDDLLTSFDEVRTSRGLQTLASTGDHIQPILFTHHKHVVDLARQTLGNSVDVVEL